MTQILIPKTLVVGFQKREGTFDGKLAFITYKNPDGSIFNETRFRKWINCPEILEFENTPQTGFSLGSSVRHGGYMSSEVVNVRIYSTQIDAEFEITIENFLEIATFSNVNRKFIEGNCVIGWKGTKNHLLSIEDPEYASIKKYSDNIYKPKSEKVTPKLEEHKFGDIFVTSSKKTLIGKHLAFFGKHSVSNILKAKKFKKSDFVHIGEHSDGSAKFDINETFSDVFLFGVMSNRVDTQKQDESFKFFQEVIILKAEDVEFFASIEDYGNRDVKNTTHTRKNEGDFNWEIEEEITQMKYIEIEERFNELKNTAREIKEITGSVKYKAKSQKLNMLYPFGNFPNTGKMWLTDQRIIEFTSSKYKVEPKAVAFMENGKMVFKPVNIPEINNKGYVFSNDEMKEFF